MLMCFVQKREFIHLLKVVCMTVNHKRYITDYFYHICQYFADARVNTTTRCGTKGFLLHRRRAICQPYQRGILETRTSVGRRVTSPCAAQCPAAVDSCTHTAVTAKRALSYSTVLFPVYFRSNLTWIRELHPDRMRHLYLARRRFYTSDYNRNINRRAQV